MTPESKRISPETLDHKLSSRCPTRQAFRILRRHASRRILQFGSGTCPEFPFVSEPEKSKDSDWCDTHYQQAEDHLSKCESLSILWSSNPLLFQSMPPLINSDYFKLNALERMRFALWNYRSERKFGDLKFEKTIIVEIPNKKWENDLIRIATWLLHSEHFRMLPLEEKMAIFKKIWMRWRKFEKWLISVDTFGHKVYKENVSGSKAFWAF